PWRRRWKRWGNAHSSELWSERRNGGARTKVMRSFARAKASCQSSGAAITLRKLAALFLLDALPHFFDCQPAAELAGVIPLVPLDLPRELLGLSLELLEDIAHPVLRRLDVLVALECVAPAEDGGHLALPVVNRPHELCRGDVLQVRITVRAFGFLSAILGGDDFPGADQLIVGLRGRRRFGRSD